jgi:predicted transcriptional regulator
MKRREGLEIVCAVLLAVADPKNDNTPYRIQLASRLNPVPFTKVIVLLEREHLIQILRGVRPSGSRNKFFIEDKGRYLIELYRKIISILGKTDDLFENPELLR